MALIKYWKRGERNKANCCACAWGFSFLYPFFPSTVTHFITDILCHTQVITVTINKLFHFLFVFFVSIYSWFPCMLMFTCLLHPKTAGRIGWLWPRLRIKLNKLPVTMACYGYILIWAYENCISILKKSHHGTLYKEWLSHKELTWYVGNLWRPLSKYGKIKNIANLECQRSFKSEAFLLIRIKSEEYWRDTTQVRVTVVNVDSEMRKPDIKQTVGSTSKSIYPHKKDTLILCLIFKQELSERRVKKHTQVFKRFGTETTLNPPKTLCTKHSLHGASCNTFCRFSFNLTSFKKVPPYYTRSNDTWKHRTHHREILTFINA